MAFCALTASHQQITFLLLGLGGVQVSRHRVTLETAADTIVNRLQLQV